jgi:apolipoprotein N-acyltransferase
MTKLGGWQRTLMLVAAGALTGLTQPPTGLWPLMFLCVPVLILTLDSADRQRRMAQFCPGFLFGLGYFSVVLHWIGFAFLVDAETYLWMMPFMVGALAGGMSVYWGLATLVAGRMWCGGICRVMLFASCLALAEWLRGHLFTGFPWAVPGLIAMEMGGVRQLASVIGMTGLSFVIVLWAGAPVLLFDQRRIVVMTATALLALLPLAWAWGSWRVPDRPVDNVAGVKLRIVQPNIPQNDKWRDENHLPIFEKLISMSRRGEPSLSGATHVIWPESAVPFLIDESAEALAMLDELLPDDAVLLMGALRRERDQTGETHVFNSILGFDGFANVVVRYDKWRLVPGGEFLPLAWLLEPLGFRKVVTVPGSFTAGPGPQSLTVPAAPEAGFSVCYEAIFPNGIVGVERPAWLVNVTNDGWFGNSTGPYQHLAQARMRAIEQGLPIIRAANTGISAVVDPYGRVLTSLTLGQEGVIDSSLPTGLSPTPYVRFGDIILAILLIVGIVPAAVTQLRMARRPPILPKSYNRGDTS